MRQFGKPWAVCLLLLVTAAGAGCSNRRDGELSRMMIATRNAVWARGVDNELEPAEYVAQRSEMISAARSELIRLRAFDVSGINPELRELHASLVDLCERRLAVLERFLQFQRELIGLKDGNPIHMLLSIPRMSGYYAEQHHLTEEQDALLKRFEEWDERFDTFRRRKGWRLRSWW